GRENVFLYASVLGLKHDEVAARFDSIESFADIGEFIEQPVKTYSSGMVVRLAFAVIAHVDADILVIDEALAVGDAFFVQKCMRFLRRFMEHGTVLFVSHDTTAVINLCETAVWLANGVVKFQGTPKEASERYLAALFESQQGESLVEAAPGTALPDGGEVVADPAAQSVDGVLDATTGKVLASGSEGLAGDQATPPSAGSAPKAVADMAPDARDMRLDYINA